MNYPKSPYILSSLLDLSITGAAMGQDLKLLERYVEEFGVYTLTGDDVCNSSRIKSTCDTPSTPVLHSSAADEHFNVKADGISDVMDVEESRDSKTRRKLRSARHSTQTEGVIPCSPHVHEHRMEQHYGKGDDETSESDEDYIYNSDYDSTSESSESNQEEDSDFEVDNEDSNGAREERYLQEAIRKHRLEGIIKERLNCSKLFNPMSIILTTLCNVCRYISKVRREIRKREKEEARKLRVEKLEQYKEQRRAAFERYLCGDTLCCNRGCLASFTEEKKESARYLDCHD